jgi:carboxymethylenebutenolidase
MTAMATGTTISIPMEHGVTEAYVARPSGARSVPPVLFFQDGLGLRPALFEMANRLASHGYHVLLPNMFWRSGPFEPFDASTVFAGPGPEMDRLMKIVLAVTSENAMRDVAAFLDHLGAQPDVTDRGRRVACVGYCMGGGLSVCAACSFPDRVVAAASIHGGRFLTAPESPEIIAKQLRARVYIGVAEIDRTHTPEVTRQLAAALAEAGVPHQIELYPEVTHGFAVPDLPPYNAEAAERHWERVLALLREAFPPGS